MIRRPEVTYIEGEPLRTVDHNRVVSASHDIARAWPQDHGPTGQHDGPRFEKGGFVYDATAQVISSSGIESVTRTGSELRVELSEPFASPDHWGLMVRVSDEIGVPSDRILHEIVDGRKTGSVGFLRLNSDFGGIQRVTVIVVGYRRRIAGEPRPAPIGSKLIPVRETAHPSGVGDVVSVEQLNGVVAFANDLADAVEREHQATHDGPYLHANPQFAVAAACVDFSFGEDEDTLLANQRVVWAEGFAAGGEPRLVMDPDPPWESRTLVNNEPVEVAETSIYLEWTLPTGAEQWPDVGYALAQAAPSIHVGWQVTQKTGDPMARLYVCRVRSEDGGPFEPVELFPLNPAGLADMRRIYLMIRTHDLEE